MKKGIVKSKNALKQIQDGNKNTRPIDTLKERKCWISHCSLELSAILMVTRVARECRGAQLLGFSPLTRRLRRCRMEALGGFPLQAFLRYLLTFPTFAEAPHFTHHSMLPVISM